MKKKVDGNEEINEKLFGWNVVILFGIFLIIGIVFYVSLSIVKNGGNLGSTSGGVTLSPDEKKDFSLNVKEILFAFAFAALMTGFLMWINSLMMKNPYMGFGAGIIEAGIIEYGFSLNYKGFYSTIFMIIGGLIVLIFLGNSFIKYKNEDT